MVNGILLRQLTSKEHRSFTTNRPCTFLDQINRIVWESRRRSTVACMDAIRAKNGADTYRFARKSETRPVVFRTNLFPPQR